MIGRAVAAGLAALGLVALGGTPVWAADRPVPIDPTALRSTARQAEPPDAVDRELGCAAIAEFMATVDYTARSQDVDGWTFGLPAEAEGEFAELRLIFTTPDVRTVTVTIPSSGHGWLGHLGSTGGGTSRAAYLVTPAEWRLVGGEATVSGGGAEGPFEVGTTCAGLPVRADGVKQHGPTGADAADTEGAPPNEDDGQNGLPSTGVAVGSVLLVGAGLVAAGVALVGQRQRFEVP